MGACGAGFERGRCRVLIRICRSSRPEPEPPHPAKWPGGHLPPSAFPTRDNRVPSSQCLLNLECTPKPIAHYMNEAGFSIYADDERIVKRLRAQISVDKSCRRAYRDRPRTLKRLEA